MAEEEIRATIAAELAGTGAPAWVVPLLMEIRGVRDEVGELSKEVRGGGPGPGHAEQLRHLDGRVGRLERLATWVAGIGTAVLIALATAWAVFAGGPRPGGHV